MENDFDKAVLYHGIIENEVLKPEVPSCFPGAWYRKCVSSRDYWLGIEAIVILPEFYPDPDRFEFFDKDTHLFKKPYLRPLDSPSIYLGGFAGFETDIGFGYNRGFINRDCTLASDEKFAFVPFWRYIYPNENKEIQNIYKNIDFKQVQFYFYPGDKVRMAVYSLKKDYLRLKIELLKPTTNPKFVELRNKLGVNPENIFFMSPLIPSPGQGINKAEFKRVNAIDQFYTEGKPAKLTNSYTSSTIWEEVYLYRLMDNKLVKVPFNDKRYAGMTCPVEEAIKIKYDGVNCVLGGEKVAIDPRGVKY